MFGTLREVFLGAVFLSWIRVVSAEETNAGVIAAGVVAGVLLLLVFAGITIYCFYRRRGPFAENQHTHKKHKVFVANGYHPQMHQHYVKRNHHHISNGYVKSVPASAVVKSGPPPLPAFVEPEHYPPVTIPYATYHGPPPEIRHAEQHLRAGTLSGPPGPPPIFIPFETTGGTLTVRADPRPVVHKSKYRKRDTSKDDRSRSPSKQRSQSRHRSRPPSQEFVVQQSYDGIPVIRPVIYIDDDDDDRRRHRSKSRDRNHRKKQSPSPHEDAKIIEIPVETEAKQSFQAVIEPQRSSFENVPNRHQTSSYVSVPEPKPSSRPRTPKERSRASSVTEAVNALRMSVKDHIDDDSDSTFSHSSSKAPSFRWAHNEHRAPEPAAGDVMFFPADAEVETERNKAPHLKQKEEEQVYSYTKVIKLSTKKRASSPELRSSPVAAPVRLENEGYEVPKSLRKSTVATRDEEPSYQTEHDRVTSGNYGHIGASMSDRLQHLVEDGDKLRVTHYNVGAIDFGDEEPDAEKIEMRVKRPETPPIDIPKNSFYSQGPKRPNTPPNDIPLTSRDSAEVPRLNLGSAVQSPRETSSTNRPSTPPKDFPITPQSSFIRPRPKTPPTDFPMTPTGDATRPETPPYDAPETSRSAAVDPATGQPGSFQARQKLIEAHLMKNAHPGPSKPAATQFSAPKPTPTPAPQRPLAVAPIKITPGVIPPAPPPPPLPVVRPK